MTPFLPPPQPTQLIAILLAGCCLFFESRQASILNSAVLNPYANKITPFVAAVITHTCQSHPASKAIESTTVGIAISTAPTFPPTKK